MNELWPWLVLFALGAFHGLNPAMGWLFAVSLGLQERRRAAVWRALPPIALGHALSITAIVGLLALAQGGLSRSLLKGLCAASLLGLGVMRLWRARHPRWAGMRVGFRDLTWWSFLMASAHGAGLMLLPVLLYRSGAVAVVASAQPSASLGVDPMCTGAFAPFNSVNALLAAVGIHTLGHLAVAGALAVLVYEKLGLALLRTAWFNVDLLWAAALVATGLLVVLV
ncbi:MAG TPA: hypothetical protein VI454_11140 [Verrucomicrobiae bacterium]|jgi:hypothetical protein